MAEPREISAEEKAMQILEETELGGRKPSDWSRWLIFVLALGWSSFQVWATWSGTLNDLFFNAVHLSFALSLVFLVYPYGKKSRRDRIPWLDWLLGAAATLSALYVVREYQAFLELRAGIATSTDLWFGSAAIVLLLLAAWRALGPAMPIIALVFMLYGLLGPQGMIKWTIPGALGELHGGYSWKQLVSQLYLTTSDSIWGTPIRVAASTVFVFVLFGAILDRAGAGKWFTDLAFSLLGGVRGGPAKASIIASALNGIVSGSAVSNVVTGGNFTISAMKRAGYSAEKAGAIEVASSSNGQLMPPVMGAAAFIMADLLGVPYVALILMAIVPALLAYGTLLVVADFEAAKLGLKGLPRSELPPLWPTFLSGAHYALPIGYMIGALVWLNRSPERTALETILIMLLVVLLQELVVKIRSGKGLLEGLRSFGLIALDGFVIGARNMVGISVATAVAGIIIGMVVLTNLGTGLADLVQALSQGNVLLALFLAQIVSLILGMGLPTTANYVIMASLVVPVVLKISQAAGLDYGNLSFAGNEVPIIKISANMFAFYFGIMADSTPPVALAAYAAAAISRGDPVKTGIQGFIYELRTALLAYMVFFNPALLLIGVSTFGQGLWIVGTAFLGLVTFAAATMGYLVGNANWIQRAMLLGAALFLVPSATLYDWIGLGLLALTLAWQWLAKPVRRLA